MHALIDCFLPQHLGKTDWPVDDIEQKEDNRERDNQHFVQMLELVSVPELFLGGSVNLEVSLEKSKKTGVSDSIQTLKRAIM